jgi:hypothetical protein
VNIYYYYLTVDGFLADGSDTIVKHNTQMAHIIEITHQAHDTAHKITQTIRDTTVTQNTIQIPLINITINS